MHAYDAETGEPRHTIRTKPGAKNAERPTTIADLRKNPWFPSVTTVISDIAAPDLENWRINEHLKAAYETPAIFDETFDDWARAVRERATKGAADAADFGTRIHAAIETATKDGFRPDSVPFELRDYCLPALDAVRALNLKETHPEGVSVNRAIGYAGTVDLTGWATDPEGMFDFPTIPVVLDYKTKRTKPNEKIVTPETYPWQIAAYHVSEFGKGQRELHPHAIGYNLFISSTEKGRTELVRYDSAPLEEGWEAFKLCHRLFCIRNKFKPKTTQ